VNRMVTLTLPADPAATSAAPADPPAAGEAIIAWTLPSPGTLAALTGAPGALSLDRFVSR